jgi:low temperature requirement protein LtrA
MSTDTASQGLLRTRNGHAHGRVTFVELFFDLVFVFAVTQLSHSLLHHLNLEGLAQTTLLLMAVWWVWIYTCWVTNWLDPDRTPVRLLMFALMLAGLVLSTSIPHAFEGKAAAFAVAYVFMQLARTGFMTLALRRASPGNYRNFQRILSWLALSSVFWIAGVFVEGQARFWIWVLALAIEYVSPMVRFWTPGLGASQTSDWDVEGSHLAERCGLFVIIALGESVLVTGSKFAGLAWTPITVAAFLVGFVGSVAMWWIYFNVGAARASQRIAGSSDPGRIARLSYTYLHLPLVAGIIVAAVGDDLTLSHPTDAVDGKTAAVLVGAPALYLLGNLLFKRFTASSPALSHMVGLGLLVLLVPLAGAMSVLTFSAAAALVLVVVAVWETLSLSGAPGSR